MPRGTYGDPRGVGVSYERGTPARLPRIDRCASVAPGVSIDAEREATHTPHAVLGIYLNRSEASAEVQNNLQGYLAHKKQRPPRTLP